MGVFQFYQSDGSPYKYRFFLSNFFDKEKRVWRMDSDKMISMLSFNFALYATANMFCAFMCYGGETQKMWKAVA